MNNYQIREAIASLTDSSVRQMYLDDPYAAYQKLQQSMNLPDLSGEEEFRVVTNTVDKLYIVLPEKEDQIRITDEQIKTIRAGSSVSSIASTDCFILSFSLTLIQPN